jgi:WD40 repeat protein
MRVTGGLTALLLGTGIVIVQPVATALTPKEISEIARQITVRIDGANTGSGVIIERQGNVYTVVTNWHVVQLKGSYTVQTSDGQRYTFNNSQVKQFRGVDLAVFQFTSNRNYRVAEKGNSDQVALGTNIAVAGYPQGTSDIDFRRGAISRLVSQPKDGYAFVYDIGGFPGMSGGAILDEQGKLVGIHGRATTRPDTNATTVLGIPLNTYLILTPFKPAIATAPIPNPSNPPISNLSPANTRPVVTANNSSRTFVLANTLNNHSDNINSVAISRDNKTLASGAEDKTIKIWNITTGEEIMTLNGHSRFVQSIAFSPDGKTLASGSVDKTIKIWNVATGKEIRTLKGHTSSVESLAFSPDGKTLASCGWDNTIKILNVATGKEVRTLKGHTSSVESLAFSPDSKTLASGSHDKNIKIWNLATGQAILSFNGHSHGSKLVAFHPDGKTLASTWHNSIKIWDVATGKLIHTLNGHALWVRSVAFSPDGKTLASGSYDNTVKIWNVATAQEISTLKGHFLWVRSVAFSPDGKTLASSSSDIKIWRLSE